MRSKALVRFLNRAACFDEDLELVSVMSVAVRSGDLSPAEDDELFTHIDAAEHPRLTKTKVNDSNREKVIGHLRQTLYAAHVKDLYEDFVDYLAEISRSVMRKGIASDAVRGDYKLQIAAFSILDSGSWEAVLDSVNDALEARLKALGTHKTVEFLDKRIGLELDQGLVEIAFRYLDLRHLLVHEDGRADERFCKAHPDLLASPGRTIKLDATATRDARLAITALVEHLDAKAVGLKVLSVDDLQ